MAFGADTIAQWTRDQLARFIQQQPVTPQQIPNAMTFAEVMTTRRLTVGDELVLSPQAIKYLKTVLGLP